jgi:riboflavin kinase/FMN adenylyltransferase
MTNIGNHPTIDALENNIIETNVLNFTGDLYGKIIKVSFLRYIREQRKFSSLKELREQLLKDIKEIDDGTI